MGPGRGIAAGWRRPREGTVPQGLPYDRPDREGQRRMLTHQARDLQVQLDAVRKRLDEIDTAPESS
jgi:hypothetical protein